MFLQEVACVCTHVSIVGPFVLQARGSRVQKHHGEIMRRLEKRKVQKWFFKQCAEMEIKMLTTIASCLAVSLPTCPFCTYSKTHWSETNECYWHSHAHHSPLDFKPQIRLKCNIFKLTHTHTHTHTHTEEKIQYRHRQQPVWLGLIMWGSHAVGENAVFCVMWPLGSCPATDKAPIPPGAQSNQSPERLEGND